MREIKNNGFLWIDILTPNKDEMKKLAERFPFHELNLEDCLSKFQIPKIDRYEDHIFVILNLSTIEKETIPRSSQLAVFIGSGYLVTVHHGELRPISEIFEQCNRSAKAREELMGRSAGYLFHSIIDALTYDLLNLVRKIVGNIEDIEDVVFDERADATREISYIRRQITALRRIAIPLKRTVYEIAAKDIRRFSEEDLTLYFDDVNDHIDKVIDTLEESRETIEIYKDTDYSHGTDRSNKILAILTIIFTLSMPVTIMSSLYGMNVDVPAIEEESLKFLGRYTTFILIVILSSVGAVAMALYFRRIRWI
ncbi:MAG: magnesium transporter CorA family protein [Thermoproteota archaeon]|nr:magnesium transporter CorA family protein [Thermoproteota archaeon]